jgi:lysophospholipase L1-like esterase
MKPDQNPQANAPHPMSKRQQWVEWEMTHLMAPIDAAKSALAQAEGIFGLKPNAPVLVAEGDSWFDYPPGFDVLNWLRDGGYAVHSVANAGATVEQMVYGPDNDQPFEDFFRRDPSQLAETMRYIKEQRPAAVLFSGGGNDIAGDELLSLLNHKNVGGDPLRVEMVEALFNTALKDGYRSFLNMVAAEAAAQNRVIPVFGHGYDYPFPDGRGVINFLNFHFVGPWLRPSINRKGYDDTAGKQIVARLMDYHNNMLQSLQAEFSFFRHIDLRGTLPNQDDWANELHPTNAGFKKITAKFIAALQAEGIVVPG